MGSIGKPPGHGHNHRPLKPVPPAQSPIQETPQKAGSRLERFMDKVDRNDDGNLSKQELRSAADTNNDGKVSSSEKNNMREKLQNYISDPDAIRGLTDETVGKAKQMMEFLDNPKTTDTHDFPGGWNERPTFPGGIILHDDPGLLSPHIEPLPEKPPKIEGPWNQGPGIKYASTFCTRY